MDAPEALSSDLAMPALDDSPTSPGVVDAASAWRFALSHLTEREAAVLSLRYGALGGERLSFAAIASRLGTVKQRAHQIYVRAIEVLRSLEGTREFAATLAMKDELLGTEGATDDVALDEASSDRDTASAMKLVAKASRELSLAIEACRRSGDEGLVVVLESARSVVSTHMREMELTLTQMAFGDASASTANHSRDADHDRRIKILRQTGGKGPKPARDPSLPRRGRGRPVDPARLAMLERVQRGELDHTQAATELGLPLSRWREWLSYQAKKAGGQRIIPPAQAAGSFSPPHQTAGAGEETRRARRGRPMDPAMAAARLAMLERVQRGELNHAEAAAELGIPRSRWMGWLTYHANKAASGTSIIPAAHAAALTPAIRRKPVDPVETARRVSVYQRLKSGELTNAQAAAELGMHRWRWESWKREYRRRRSMDAAPELLFTVPLVIEKARATEAAARREADPSNDVAALRARLDSLQRLGAEFRDRLQDLVSLMERWFPK